MLALFMVTLAMPPRIIFLRLRIIPLREIHMIAMRLMLPIVVVNHLAMIPSMVVAITSIVSSHFSLATANDNRPTQTQCQNHHRKIPK